MNLAKGIKMKKVVWKYPVEIKGKFEIVMPHDAQILKCENQFDRPFLWALVNPEEKVTVTKRFILLGTGHETEEQIVNHISTFQVQNGAYIFHLFEVL